MQQSSNIRDGINLRMVVLKRDQRWAMICLDTDIAVVADTLEELQRKMNDASLLYLGSCTPAELSSGKYRRSAPLKYYLLWGLHTSISKLTHILNGATTATYDPHSSGLRFA